MDIVTAGMIGGAALLILATLWNALVAPKKGTPTRLFQYFMEHYGFATNDQATIYNGFYKGRAIQLRKEPPGALIQVANPRMVHLLIEKGKTTTVPDLLAATVPGLQGVTVKSNYPLLVQQVIDEPLIKALNEAEQYSFELKEGLTLTTPKMRNPQRFEQLLALGVQLATAIERINYLGTTK